MRIAGRVPADRPDPMEEVRNAAAALRVPVAGLVPQRHLEDWGVSGTTSDRDGVGPAAVVRHASFTRMYTLWRNPDERSDPVNLAVLTPELQHALDRELPPDLPPWIVRQRDRMRYPTLWEAVQTHWFNPTFNADTDKDPGSLLRSHVDYVLYNQYRAQYALQPVSQTHGPDQLVSLMDVQPTNVVVDGTPRPGVIIDTNPFVHGAGVALDDGRVLTTVIARNVLDLVELKLVNDAWQPPTPSDPSTPSCRRPSTTQRLLRMLGSARLGLWVVSAINVSLPALLRRSAGYRVASGRRTEAEDRVVLLGFAGDGGDGHPGGAARASSEVGGADEGTVAASVDS